MIVAAPKTAYLNNIKDINTDFSGIGVKNSDTLNDKLLNMFNDDKKLDIPVFLFY